MKKTLLYLPFVLLLAGAFISCEEVEEVGEYDNWRERNEAFVDSLKAVAGNNYVATPEAADAMEIGKLYAIQNLNAGTNVSAQYIYCKKLVANTEGDRPMGGSGYNDEVSTYYYGTLINGEKFDGNFTGYTALDKNIPNPPQQWPTDFDSPTTFGVTDVITGWTWALYFMHSGERWQVFIPQQSAYGTSDSGSIPGYSTLCFDMILEKVYSE
ncbi:MAG: FKBP-type peptidyl-prolyl cis-trans isomerase [Bacteroides sp.]|nr:FKBP-type peptidyl-prolyl cis-trans isomerase [Bacteroides sp.]